MENTIKSKWEALHAQRRFRPKYPNEEVVQFIFGNFKRDGSEKVLDLGCGGGRHTLLFANEGIIPYGIDISGEGVKYTQELLLENGYGRFADNIVCGSFEKLSFEDNFFDGILAYGTLYYGESAIHKAAIREMYRTLQGGGVCLALVRGHEDYRYGQGKEIEPNTFVIDITDERASASAEVGMVMHFFSPDELKELFKDFSSVEIDTKSSSRIGGEFLNFDYLVIARK